MEPDTGQGQPGPRSLTQARDNMPAEHDTGRGQPVEAQYRLSDIQRVTDIAAHGGAGARLAGFYVASPSPVEDMG